MFDSWNQPDGDWELADRLEARVLATEAAISRLRAQQVADLRILDRLQVDTGDGARTLADWVSAQLDLSHQTSSRLTTVARAADTQIDANLRDGRWGLDRAAALCKLRAAGIVQKEFDRAAEGYSLGRLYGLLDRLRKVDPAGEAFTFENRYLVMQPSLDESAYRLWGVLPGVDGQTVERALTRREGDLPVLPGEGQSQRRADALTAICMDSLTGSSVDGTETGRAVTVAEVFIDAHHASHSAGEEGVTLSTGPRVGPNTLQEILCGGKVRVIITDGTRPLSYTDLGEAIPPTVRSFILWRDQGQCSIEGCHSRYRLQPHHITPRAHGGSHDPENLATLCWYHHHVAIHQRGMTIDPGSPTHRRRLMWPGAPTNGPPDIREMVLSSQAAQ
ncbi:MAG: DUF222 domain-containing protein [Actinomycetota bacterium]